MEQCRTFFEKDAFANHCGVELLEAGKGSAKTRLQIRPEHCNGVGIVHGAAIFTLADAAFGAAANSYDFVAVAVTVTLSFLKAVHGGVLTAQAREINRDGRIGNYTIHVKDEAGDIVSVFEGLAYRKFNRPRGLNDKQTTKESM